MDGCIEKGCVLPRAMREALEIMKDIGEFIFINSRSVLSFRPKHQALVKTRKAFPLPASEFAESHLQSRL
jgi:hypothetical protein